MQPKTSNPKQQAHTKSEVATVTKRQLPMKTNTKQAVNPKEHHTTYINRIKPNKHLNFSNLQTPKQLKQQISILSTTQVSQYQHKHAQHKVTTAHKRNANNAKQNTTRKFKINPTTKH